MRRITQETILPAPAPTSTRWTRLKQEVTTRIGIDPRALAVLRVSLGLVLLMDLAYRARNLTAFYTDRGVLPRSAVTARWPESEVMLHSLSGDAWLQVVLFAAQALVAVALVVGFQTRLATVLSFLLLLSLHTRNVFILNAGDVLLRVLLFWCMFLPLGARWSIDALGRAPPRPWVMDFATAAVLLQVVIVYALNAVQKYHGGAWTGGDALLYVFNGDRYMTSLGQLSLHFPAMLTFLSKAWLGLLTVSPLLLLATGRLRMLLVALFAGAHLGMLAAMQLGIFPLVSLIALVLFLPAMAWDFAERNIVAPLAAHPAALRLRARIERLRTRPPPLDAAPKRTAERARIRPERWLTGGQQAIAAILLAWLVASTAMTAGIASPPDELPKGLKDRERKWAMFAVPGTWNMWVAVPAVLKSGTQIDAFHLDNKSWEEPRYAKDPYPDNRWRKFLDSALHPSRDDLRTHFATYLCARWNDTQDDKMVALTIYRVDQTINLTGPDPAPVRYELTNHNCEG